MKMKNQLRFEEEERSKFTRQHAHEIEQRTGELKTKLLEFQKMNDDYVLNLGQNVQQNKAAWIND